MVLISPLPDQEGNKLGNMSGTRAISTTSRRELSSGFFFFLQGKVPNEIDAILTETLACLLPGRAKDLSAPLFNPSSHGAVTPSVPSGLQAVPLRDKAPREIHAILTETLVCFLPGRAKDLSAPLYVVNIYSVFLVLL